MKDKLEKALGQIPLPDNLESEVLKGVGRAASERSSFLPGSVRKIAAAAAAFVIIAAAGFGFYSLNKTPEASGNSVYRFMGYEPGTKNPVVVEISAEGNIVGRVNSDGVILRDESGETVEPDSVVLMLAYWIDENGELECTDIPFGAFSAEASDGAKIYKLEGFNADDFGDHIIFSPNANLLGSVEEGTAYDVGENDLKITLEKLPDGTMQFVFTPSDAEKYPYSEIKEYHLHSVMGFESGPEFLGGQTPGSEIASELKLPDTSRGENCFWEISSTDNTLKITGAESEVNGWVLLSSLQAKMSDGSFLELHLNRIIKVKS